MILLTRKVHDEMTSLLFSIAQFNVGEILRRNGSVKVYPPYMAMTIVRDGVTYDFKINSKLLTHTHIWGKKLEYFIHVFF